MKAFPIVTATLALAAVLAPAPARAQSSNIDLRPELTKEAFAAFTSDVGSILRFRQLGDNTPLGKGNMDVGVQFANAPVNDSERAWSLSFPRIVGRFGVNDRVDVGIWGGINADSNYGLVGFDTRIALITEGPGRPVSVSIRPSVTSLIGPSSVWVGNASIDISASRTFGRVSPYVGVGTTGSLAIERSKDVDLDPATANGSLAYAGLSYRWRMLSLSAEVEKGNEVSYGFKVGTRF